ncbi:uncharacterized protein LOC126379528 [Pectinophora gossypiella]|uniref:uncharacterized protein LOC126379528 n=1 Tax=Pectinophora gossypiella TaxID=13191 RepID=UPI00214E54A3|nr:uncharacterized protein LOC126379528 [Pectinophora gossypiella]
MKLAWITLLLFVYNATSNPALHNKLKIKQILKNIRHHHWIADKNVANTEKYEREDITLIKEDGDIESNNQQTTGTIQDNEEGNAEHDKEEKIVMNITPNDVITIRALTREDNTNKENIKNNLKHDEKATFLDGIAINNDAKLINSSPCMRGNEKATVKVYDNINFDANSVTTDIHLKNYDDIENTNIMAANNKQYIKGNVTEDVKNSVLNTDTVTTASQPEVDNTTETQHIFRYTYRVAKSLTDKKRKDGNINNHNKSTDNTQKSNKTKETDINMQTPYFGWIKEKISRPFNCYDNPEKNKAEIDNKTEVKNTTEIVDKRDKKTRIFLFKLIILLDELQNSTNTNETAANSATNFTDDAVDETRTENLKDIINNFIDIQSFKDKIAA